MKTVGVDLWGGQVRGVENRATVLGRAPRVPRPMRELFVGAYARFAPQCRAVDEPGIAIIAVDETTGRASGLVTLRARVARYVATIVGRHDRCDLFLHDRYELGLRQLAIVLDPVQSWSRDSTAVRYRVLDLRTQTGFADEHGRPLRGLRCEGTAILRCAGYALFLVPLGDPTDWPERAEDAWAMIPERVYFDELECSPRGSMPAMRVSGPSPNPVAGSMHSTRRSMIIRTQGPRETADSLVCADGTNAGRETHAGTLELIGKHHRGTLTLGHEALSDGVLIGRYARCDGAGLLDDPSLSRVHMLLLQVEDALLVVDTASRNGTRLVGEQDSRVIQLGGDTELGLGSRTRARWRWSH